MYYLFSMSCWNEISKHKHKCSSSRLLTNDLVLFHVIRFVTKQHICIPILSKSLFNFDNLFVIVCTEGIKMDGFI